MGCTLTAEKFFQREKAGILFVIWALFWFLYGVSGSFFSCSWVKFYVAMRDA